MVLTILVVVLNIVIYWKQFMSKVVQIPADFGLTPDLEAWGRQHNFSRLGERMDWFVDYCLSTGKQYVDYKAAFRNSVRADWAKLNNKPFMVQNLNTNEAKPGESMEQFMSRIRSARH